MVLHKGQGKIAESRKRFRVVDCGRGFGKTTLAIEEIIGVGVAHRDRRVLYIAPTIQQARDIAWEALKKRVLPITTKTNESRLDIKIRTQDQGESTIILRGWESIETLRGQEFDFIVIDEVASMRGFWTGWQEVLLPTLRMSKGGVLFISTPKGFNHFYDLFNTRGEAWESFHFTSYDNPLLDPKEIEQAKLTMTPDRFAQEYLADFRKQEGLVYKEFSRDLHTYEAIPMSHERYMIAGIDPGYTNPFAILDIQTDGETYWVEDEWYKTGKTDEQAADYVAAKRYKAVYPDPERPQFIAELEKRGVNTREVIKGKRSIEEGVQKIREMFLAGRLKINKRCLNLINELETYHYPDSKDGVNEDERPVKENDHALDALRYALMMAEPLAPKKRKGSGPSRIRRGTGLRSTS